MCSISRNWYFLFSSKHITSDIRIFQKFALSLSWDYRVLIINTREQNVVLCRRGKHRVVPFKGKVSRFTLLKSIFRRQPEHVHLNDPLDFVCFLGLSLFFPWKLIFDFHENLPAQILHKEYLGNWRSAISILAKVFVALVSLFPIKIVAATPVISDLFFRNKQKTVVRNLSRFTLAEERGGSPSNVRFLYLGALSKDRGSDSIVQLLQIYPLIKLDFFGPPLPEECRELDIAPNFINHGFQTWDVIQDYVSPRHCGIFLCKPLPNYLESLPTKVFDYKALGIKSLISDFSHFKRVFSDDSSLFVTPEEIAQNKDRIDFFLGSQHNISPQNTDNWSSEYNAYYSFLHETRA